MQWEYRVIEGWKGHTEDRLDKLGEDEWELVSVVALIDRPYFFFKRPVEDEPDRDE
jgi:hypothetical protein